MPPKVDIQTGLNIEDLLSYQYDPAGYKQSTFYEHYQMLVKYHDDLRKQYDRKQQTRASLREPDSKTPNLQRRKRPANTPPANPSQRSRFSILPDDDDGSSSSALTNPPLSATLSKKQLDKIPRHERKAEVRKIKEEIETMKSEMKAQKKKDNERRKEAHDSKEELEHRGAVQEDEDEAEKSGSIKGWETATPSLWR